jgi:hypothetical protein
MGSSRVGGSIGSVRVRGKKEVPVGVSLSWFVELIM